MDTEKYLHVSHLHAHTWAQRTATQQKVLGLTPFLSPSKSSDGGGQEGRVCQFSFFSLRSVFLSSSTSFHYPSLLIIGIGDGQNKAEGWPATEPIWAIHDFTTRHHFTHRHIELVMHPVTRSFHSIYECRRHITTPALRKKRKNERTKEDDGREKRRKKKAKYRPPLSTTPLPYHPTNYSIGSASRTNGPTNKEASRRGRGYEFGGVFISVPPS